jgi:WD40 repeat protein
LGYRGEAKALAFGPKSQLLALGGAEPDIILCDLESKGAARPLKMPIQDTWLLAFSPDGQTLAAASVQTNQMLLWDMAASRPRTSLRGHSSHVTCLAFSPDGRSLASAGVSDQTIIVWDLATGGQRLGLATPGAPVVALAYSPDGSLIVSASVFEFSIRIWDSVRGSVIRRLASHVSRDAIAFAPQGQLLATGDKDGTVKLWNFATGERLARLNGQTRWLNGVAFSPDGRTLAAIGDNNDVRLWDVNEVLASRSANN